MRILRLAALAIAASLLLASPSAWPQRGGGHSGHAGHAGNFAGGRHFGGMHDGGGHFGQPGFGRSFRGGGFHHGFHHGFHRGAFVHGLHDGFVGWWFVAGGFWYPWYAYATPVYSSSWYYCASAGAYYPYVTVCPEGWVLVAPTAPPL